MRKFLCILIMLFSALSLAACGKKEETNTIRYIGFKIYDPVYVAQEKGFFSKHNVEVEIIELLAGGPTALQVISGGSAEVCASSYMAVINARVQGLPVMAISDIQSAIGEQALEEFFVRKDSGINSIADLKGKSIAINLVKSSFHYTWIMALADVGLTEDDVEFVVLSFDQQELALANGSVDAIGVMQPYVGSAKQNEEIKTLYTALDVFGEKQFTAHVINNDWAENHPKQVDGFVAAIAETVAWIEANQEEAKVIISKYTGVATENIDDYYFQKNAAIIIDDAQYWLDYMRSTGEVTADWLRVKDFATNRYNPYE